MKMTKVKANHYMVDIHNFILKYMFICYIKTCEYK